MACIPVRTCLFTENRIIGKRLPDGRNDELLTGKVCISNKVILMLVVYFDMGILSCLKYQGTSQSCCLQGYLQMAGNEICFIHRILFFSRIRSPKLTTYFQSDCEKSSNLIVFSSA